MSSFDSNPQAVDQIQTLSAVLGKGSETDGSSIIVTSSDEVQGVDDLNGTILRLRGGNSTGGNNAGGTARLEGGEGDGTGDGGNVLIRGGASSGSGDPGLVILTNNGGADTIPVARLTSEGTNGASFHLFTGDRNPTGFVTPIVGGDVYIRDTGELFIATGVTPADWSCIGGTNAVRELVDTLASPLTTGNATGLGGTANFTIVVNESDGEMKQLRVVTASGICADATVEFFRDGARTDLIYSATNIDPSTQFVTRSPVTMRGDDGSTLEANSLHGRITNNDAGDATFDVGIWFWG